MPKHFLQIKTWPIILIIWAMDTLLTFTQVYLQGVLPVDALHLALLESLSSALCASILCYIILPVFIRQRKIIIFVVIAMIICLLLSSTTIFLTLPVICNCYRQVSALPQMCSISALLPGIFITMLFSSGTVCGFRFYQEYARTLIDHEQLRTTHLEAELTLLRDQLNPHFVFNMMNSIHILIEKDTGQAADMVLEFSDMLRYQLYDCSKPVVTLQQEIIYLQNYVNVENKRRGNELQVDCYWEPHTPHCHISPLILTSFVENAFKHVSRFTDKPNFIRMELFLKDNSLFFMVKNSKEPYDPIAGAILPQKGIGLVNVQKRLSLLYPEQYSLKIEEAPDLFTIFLEVKIKCC